MTTQKTTDKNKCLSPQETKLIQLIRSIEYGEIHVIIKDNKPILVEQIKKSIKLD